jgi:hypothetical protein
MGGGSCVIDARSFRFFTRKQILKTRKIRPNMRSPYSAVETAMSASRETAPAFLATQQLRNPPAQTPKIVRKRLEKNPAVAYAFKVSGVTR